MNENNMNASKFVKQKYNENAKSNVRQELNSIDLPPSIAIGNPPTFYVFALNFSQKAYASK